MTLKLEFRVIFFCLLYSINTNGQNIFQLSFSHSLLQYNRTINQLQTDYGYKMNKNNFTVNSSVLVHNSKKTNIYIGFSYKKINYQIVDRISKFTYVVEKNLGSGGYISDTLVHLFTDPADLISKSNNLGFIFEVKREFFSSNYTHHFIGISNEIYFWEKFTSKYQSSDFNDENPEIVPFTNYYGNLTPFNFHSNSTSIFYNFLLQVNEQFSLATKISLCTNLYSDWDQFKKYAWLGVGLELGFGKKKIKEVKD